jgi:hypothetical protein
MVANELNKRADSLQPQIHEGFSRRNSRARVWIEGRIRFGEGLLAAAGICVIVLSAAVFFKVRELLAALLLFSVLFAVVAIVVFLLWLVGRAIHEAAVRVGRHVVHLPSNHIVVPVRARASHYRGSLPWN